jgi:hypothetical protein
MAPVDGGEEHRWIDRWNRGIDGHGLKRTGEDAPSNERKEERVRERDRERV